MVVTMGYPALAGDIAWWADFSVHWFVPTRPGSTAFQPSGSERNTVSGVLSFSYICQVCPLAVQVDRSTKALSGGSIVALLVTNWGLAMSKDEEISGPGARHFGLAPQVKGVSN